MTTDSGTTNNNSSIDEGWMIEWPEYKEQKKQDNDNANGSSSCTRKPITTITNCHILQAVFEAAKCDFPDEVTDALNLLKSLTSTSSTWRYNYDEIYDKLVTIQSKSSIETCIRMCQAGLDAATNSFVYRSQYNDQQNASKTLSLQDAFSLQQHQQQQLVTIEYSNTNTTQNSCSTMDDNNKSKEKDNDNWAFPLASPLDNGKTLLYGTDAINQVNHWLQYGCLEQSAADHANATFSTSSTNNNDMIQKTIFCVLGVSSELSPTKSLLRYVPNAHVIGISRNVGPIMDWYKELCESPVGAPNTKLEVSSADMLQQYPLIAKWIIDIVEKENNNSISNQSDGTVRLVLLPMGYMDGEANVRLTVAMDQIIMSVISSLQASIPITVAYWTSPSTVYTIPKDAAMDACSRYTMDDVSITNIIHNMKQPRRLLSLLSFGTLLQPTKLVRDIVQRKNNNSDTQSDSSNDRFVLNAVTKLQGPNYLLSKMLQQWRCVILSSSTVPPGATTTTPNMTNVTVLAPHAPPTRTVSVTHIPQVAAGIEGMPYLVRPLITFDVETCATLMTAILLNQMKEKSMLQQEQEPHNDDNNAKHPLDLFWDGSVHGGLWRCPYDLNTVSIPAFLIGKYLLSTNQQGGCPPESVVQSSTQQSGSSNNNNDSDNLSSDAV